MNHSHDVPKIKNKLEKSFSFNKDNKEKIKPLIKIFNSARSKITPNSNRNNSSIRNIIMNNQLKIPRSIEISINDNIKNGSELNDIKKSPKCIYNYNLSKKDVFHNYSSLRKHSIHKINLKMKRFTSTQEIKLIREINQKRNEIINYHENKIEKYKLDRKTYYNNTLKNRIRLFFNTNQKKYKYA